MMKVTILCSSKEHPVFPILSKWKIDNKHNYDISLVTRSKQVSSDGDVLFLISCSEIIDEKIKSRFKYSLVLHASNLPEGRGWSPHIWDILNGRDYITLSLLEAENGVDTGKIWKKKTIPLFGTELYDDINELLFEAEIELMTWFCENHEKNEAKSQSEEGINYYRKRNSSDSELDINKNISSQFNLLRVCDPNRFPAFFYVKGQKYNIKIEKVD